MDRQYNLDMIVGRIRPALVLACLCMAYNVFMGKTGEIEAAKDHVKQVVSGTVGYRCYQYSVFTLACHLSGAMTLLVWQVWATKLSLRRACASIWDAGRRGPCLKKRLGRSGQLNVTGSGNFWEVAQTYCHLLSVYKN